MRLAGQSKMGFYEAHADAVAAICHHLEAGPTRPASVSEVEDPETGQIKRTHHKAHDLFVLDPCAGEGKALHQIARHLGVDEGRTHAVELDAERSDRVRELMPEAPVLGPASYMATRISPGSFGLVYANPPFDWEMGGGKRQEFSFAEEATRHLKVGGILALVLPMTAIEHNVAFQNFLDSWFEDQMVYVWPEAHRGYREIVIFGKKRKKEIPTEFGFLHGQRLHYGDPTRVLGSDDMRWTVPWSDGPARFVKQELTDDEVVRNLARSPLEALLRPQTAQDARRPILPLYTGHVALMLASGLLDGVVHPPGEPPHVVRGSDQKMRFQSKAPEPERDEVGNVTRIVEVWSEKITLIVRAVGASGTIHTFDDGSGDASSKALADGGDSDDVA